MPVKPRIMSKCSARFGQCVAYFQSPEDAAIYSLRCSEQHRPDGKGGSDKHFALQVSDFAQQFLSELNAKFNLRGPARKNLGTALRVAEVRAAIDKAVLEDAEYVARGADAFRHLSGADMAKSLGHLQRLLVEVPKATGEEDEIETSASESVNGSTSSSPLAAKEAGEDAAVPGPGLGHDIEASSTVQTCTSDVSMDRVNADSDPDDLDAAMLLEANPVDDKVALVPLGTLEDEDSRDLHRPGWRLDVAKLQKPLRVITEFLEAEEKKSEHGGIAGACNDEIKDHISATSSTSPPSPTSSSVGRALAAWKGASKKRVRAKREQRKANDGMWYSWDLFAAYYDQEEF